MVYSLAVLSELCMDNLSGLWEECIMICSDHVSNYIA